MNEIKVEQWKDIKGYEGLYQVSNLGRIKSLFRKVKYQNGFRNVKEKIKNTFIGKQCYERVELSKNKENKKYNIHRLVAEAFIPNKNNKPQINHIDGNKTNNKVENLEWCTQSENELHAYKIGLAKNSDMQRKIISEYCKQNKIKPIIQLSLDNKFIKEWKSAVSVEQELGINRKSISQCINNKSKTAGGYKWVTKERFEESEYKVC